MRDADVDALPVDGVHRRRPPAHGVHQIYLHRFNQIVPVSRKVRMFLLVDFKHQIRSYRVSILVASFLREGYFRPFFKPCANGYFYSFRFRFLVPGRVQHFPRDFQLFRRAVEQIFQTDREFLLNRRWFRPLPLLLRHAASHAAERVPAHAPEAASHAAERVASHPSAAAAEELFEYIVRVLLREPVSSTVTTTSEPVL